MVATLLSSSIRFGVCTGQVPYCFALYARPGNIYVTVPQWAVLCHSGVCSLDGCIVDLIIAMVYGKFKKYGIILYGNKCYHVVVRVFYLAAISRIV